jgi:Kef-type K+ transport system membrane component KefB
VRTDRLRPVVPSQDAQPRLPRRRLLIFYVVVAAAVAVGVSLSIVAGNDEVAQPEIAGGYDLARPSPCLGPGFDLEQSGQFVNIKNAERSLSGKLRLRTQQLTGEVHCVRGGDAELDLTVRDDLLTGSVGAEQIEAQLERDPPDPGARRPRAPDSVAGVYELSPPSECIGTSIELEGEGADLELIQEGASRGAIEYRDGTLTGQVSCSEGDAAGLTGEAMDRRLDLRLTPVTTAQQPPNGAPEHLQAEKQREFGETLAAFFIAVAVVMLVARLFGAIAVRVAQPRVMGEVIAGIALGPTLFGALLPELQVLLFPTDIIPVIGVVANLGLIFYMFLVGLELDVRQLKGRLGQAAAISNASVALPMVLGMAAAVPIYALVAPEQEFVAFALFMGVAMSITAFPVLARILVERRMLKRPVGALAMAAAAIDDVTAWFLIAVAIAVATAGDVGGVLETILLAVAFCLLMFVAVRPLLARVSDAYDEAGRVPGTWIAAIFAGVLLSAFTTETIGIALIFGAFVMGMVMPRHAELTEDVTGRIEDFVVTLLLPLFFAYTGLRTNVGLLDRPELWLMTVALIVVAIAGKLFGAMFTARLTGFGWRASAVIGTLMNTRGLTELIVLNIALEKGVISEALFASLVIMALVTTLMAGPLLRVLDPRNEFGAPLSDELEQARKESEAEFPSLAVPERSILLAPQSEPGLAQLRALAEPLASGTPPRELILARLVPPPRGAAAGVRGGLQTENRLLREASDEIETARDELITQGIAARAVAFISADAGADLSHIASREDVDLVLADGRRPLLGEGVPRGEVGTVLSDAPCDVAVLVAGEGQEVALSDDASILVPFGGAEHDWAALEVGAWLAAATGASLRLLGAAREHDSSRVTRMLADAGLLVQRYAGVSAEPLVSEPGGAILDSASGAGLLVIGLSPRWRREGLGPIRSDIARVAPAPVLFVRRGSRPGALAPETDVTRFSWSTPGMVAPGARG